MDDVKPNRHIPEGVDPQSWLGFETRIEQRRFAVLSATIHEALAAGDVLAAQAALEEARGLRPDAGELSDLETRVFAASGPVRQAFWRRAAGAVGLLVAGVSMVLALDAIRRADPEGPDMSAAGSPAVPALPAVSNATVATDALEAWQVVAVPIPAPAAVSPRSIASPAAVVSLRVGTSPPPVPPRRASAPGFQRASTIASAVERLAAKPAAPAATPRMVTPERRAPEGEGRQTPATTAAVVENDAQQSLAVAGSRNPEPAVASRELPRPAPAPPANSAVPAASATVPPAGAAGPPTTLRANAAVDESRVAEVLRAYARAYGELDATAARDIWPSVDQRALARAFDSLRSQQLSLENCQIDVLGATANASCRGQAQYVGKIGSGEPRTEPRTWRFELRREGEAWKIAHAEARRPTS